MGIRPGHRLSPQPVPRGLSLTEGGEEAPVLFDSIERIGRSAGGGFPRPLGRFARG